jgi:hypothetical protein
VIIAAWLGKHDERVYSHVDATSFRVMRQRLRASGPAAPDPSAFVLMPAFVVAVIAAEVLGRLRWHHDPVPAQLDSAAAATRISHGLSG